MTQKPDLGNPDQISQLVKVFYARVATDDLLGPVFNELAQVNWQTHHHTLTSFWCKLELGIPGFNGAPTQRHAELSAQRPFTAEQFGRWIALFHDTIDSGWAGAHAESIKQRAVLIAKAQSRIVPTAEEWTGPALKLGEESAPSAQRSAE